MKNISLESRSKDKDKYKFFDIIGRTEKMQKVFNMIEKVSDSDSTIMIYGESGTGKELVAKAIHQSSYRRNKPFVSINCGAIPENLLESELFGHVKGAFTGATASKQGKFALADKGTIFLDEIGDMSHDLQVKILRILEEREVEQIGGNKSIKIDVRIIAATHRDLEKEVEKGNFRQDLFYRLHVIPLTLPPLRERNSDIPYIIDHFFTMFNRKKNIDITRISENAMAMMSQYPWPGNVRELRNMVERLMVLKGEGEIVSQDLPESLKREKSGEVFPKIEMTQDGICLNTAVSEFEKALIFKSLEKTKWVKNKAAKLLHLNRTTLVEKIKRYQLQQCSL